MIRVTPVVYITAVLVERWAYSH